MATLVVVDPGDVAVSRWVSTVGLVVGAAVVVRLLSERIGRLLAELAGAARTDHLTGLPNRRASRRRCSWSLHASRAAAPASPCSSPTSTASSR